VVKGVILLIFKCSSKMDIRVTWRSSCTNFDVLLTVHVRIILVINQLHAQNLVL